MTAALSFGCLFSDRIEPLLDGRVAVEGASLDIRILEAQRLFRQVLREAAFDVAELSMASHVAAIGRGATTYLGLPVFLSRSFRHSNLYIRADRIGRPADLAGARIGIIDWQQTAALWVRGLLADQYGVEREAVDWIAAGLHRPEIEDRVRFAPPPGISLRRSPETLDDLLRTGEIDAVISPTAPRCFGTGTGLVRRMWQDPVAEETRYWRRTGIFPIMHVAVVRRRLVEEDPSLAIRLVTAFEAARALAIADRDDRDFPKLITAWLPAHAASVRYRLGADPWTYGREANRPALDALLRYAVADGLASAELTTGDLFA